MATYRLISVKEYYVPVGDKMYRKTEILEVKMENATDLVLSSGPTKERSNERYCPSETYCPSESYHSNETYRLSERYCPSTTYCPSERYYPVETRHSSVTSNTTTSGECTCQYHLVKRGSMSPRSFARHH